MSKTPYEIRLEILDHAIKYMEKTHEIASEYAKESFNKAVELGSASVTEWNKYAPQMYSVEDIIKKANEMYGFVSSDNKKGGAK